MSRPVIAAVDDMFFASKIRAVAEHLGLDVRFVRSAAEAIAAAKEERPSVVVADLHSRKCDPFALAEMLKADETCNGGPPRRASTASCRAPPSAKICRRF